MIVISIIGILSTFVIINVFSYLARARDSQRKSDLKQIQAALELYRSDMGTYLSGTDLAGNCTSQNKITSGANCTGTVYMESIPVDPKTRTKYYYNSDGNTYVVATCVENASDPETYVEATCQASWGTNKAYRVIQP